MQDPTACSRSILNDCRCLIQIQISNLNSLQQHRPPQRQTSAHKPCRSIKTSLLFTMFPTTRYAQSRLLQVSRFKCSKPSNGHPVIPPPTPYGRTLQRSGSVATWKGRLAAETGYDTLSYLTERERRVQCSNHTVRLRLRLRF